MTDASATGRACLCTCGGLPLHAHNVMDDGTLGIVAWEPDGWFSAAELRRARAIIADYHLAESA